MSKFTYECQLIQAKFLGADPRIMKSIAILANGPAPEWAARLIFKSSRFLAPDAKANEWMPCGDVDDPESIILEVTVGGVGNEVTINAFNRELHMYTPLLLGEYGAPAPLLILQQELSYWACTDIQTQNRRRPPYDVRRIFLNNGTESRMLWYLLDGEPVRRYTQRPIGVTPTILPSEAIQ